MRAADRKPLVNGAKHPNHNGAARAAICVERLRPGREAEWQKFIVKSENGTLFEDLRFLSYHPSDRFHEHHLLFHRDGVLRAVFPSAEIEEPDAGLILRGGYGGSVGSLVLAMNCRAGESIELVRALQDYVATQGFAGVDMRLGPGIYARHDHDSLAFSLAACGFSLVKRWLTPIIQLPDDPARLESELPSKRRRTYIRRARRSGVTVERASSRELDLFYPILERNRLKKGATPTHTLAELHRIFGLVPERVALFVCKLEGSIIAGTVTFDVTDRVSYSFCPAHDEEFDDLRATSVLLTGLAAHYAVAGFRYVDLGPTGSVDMVTGALEVNWGNARFKLDMGGVGFFRDTWRWMAGASAEPDREESLNGTAEHSSPDYLG